MIAEFSILLTCGMSLMWCAMPRVQVTAGFFRIQMLIAMGLIVLAMLTMGSFVSNPTYHASVPLVFEARLASGLGLCFAYLGSIVWTLDRRSAGTYMMIGIALTSFASLILLRGGLTWLLSGPGFLLFLSNLATAGIFGGAVTGMLLGHWYLTAPTMSIEPLRKLTWYFAIAVVFRMTVSAYGWVVAGQTLHESVHWTWFALRWLAGILGPMGIAIMAIRILRYRNTQAATGVLFAGVILTFIGEMSASLLYSELQIPL